MDSHNIGRNRGSAEEVLGWVRAKTLVLGISSDLLFPTEEQIYLAKHIPEAEYAEIESLYGHDGFLIENDKISQLIRQFYLKNQL
jgi:homoserine O-acetyltransferase